MVEIAVIILCILYLVGLHVGKGLAITTLVYVGLKITQEVLRKINEREVINYESNYKERN